jgi:hypothetical protein
MKFLLGLILSTLCVLAADKDATAFELIKEGNRYVGEQARDRIIQIRSERSIGSLAPKVWYIVYFDPTATFKAVEVKFAAGKMVDVKRPFRVIQKIADSTREIDKDKMKIDSDEAIAKALKEAILEDIKVKSVEAKLENTDTGPVWKLKLWAQKLVREDHLANIGTIVITADDAKVIDTDIHLDRLD